MYGKSTTFLNEMFLSHSSSTLENVTEQIVQAVEQEEDVVGHSRRV